MFKKIIKKEILVILLFFFIFIPSKSYADVVDPPYLPVNYSGGIILLIMIAITVLVGFCVFIIREEYKKEKVMKILKKIVIVFAYFLIAWLAYSTAENLIAFANYNGRFSVKENLVDLIFLFILTAVFIISMIYRIQNEKGKAYTVLFIGCMFSLLVFFWGVLIHITPSNIWNWDIVYYTCPQCISDLFFVF